jgi:hypothetical protein
MATPADRRTTRWLERLNTAMLGALVLVTVATLIGVYTLRPGVGPEIPTGEPSPFAVTAATLPGKLSTPLGRTVIIPMGFYYGTYVMHLWLRTFERPFRMRVDTGSSSLLFGDLNGCFSGPHALCLQEPPSKHSTIHETFAETTGITVRPAVLRPYQATFGFIGGVPRVEPTPLSIRVGDNSRTFLFGMGFGDGQDGLLNQLMVRRVQLWLVNQTWSLRMPCQIVLSPTTRFDPDRVLLQVPLVPPGELVAATGDNSTYESATYIFALENPPPPLAATVQFAVIDIGSTLSYVPLRPGTVKIEKDIVINVAHTSKVITLAREDTVPIDTLPIGSDVANIIVIIGNRALNQLIVDVDLDDGPTGTLRLIKPL